MRRILPIIGLLFGAFCGVAAQDGVYHGQVSVKQNDVRRVGNQVEMDFEIGVSGLSVGRYQTLTLIPLLRHGGDSLLLPPVVLNGKNKQKMYERTLALQGREAADAGAYEVLPNNPLLLQVIRYKKSFPFRRWMQKAEFVLVGELAGYEGQPLQTFRNVLTEALDFSDSAMKEVKGKRRKATDR